MSLNSTIFHGTDRTQLSQTKPQVKNKEIFQDIADLRDVNTSIDPFCFFAGESPEL
jgi:hypothetical protein